MNNTELVLTLYSRPECHLCEDMLNGLKSWQNRFDFKVEIVDIDQDTSLTDRFAARIPILTAADIEICQYYLDENALSRFFKSYN